MHAEHRSGRYDYGVDLASGKSSFLDGLVNADWTRIAKVVRALKFGNPEDAGVFAGPSTARCLAPAFSSDAAIS
jgi:hypothetical protein